MSMTPAAPVPTNRIRTLQRQLRQLGRIRTGTWDPSAAGGKGRPTRSETFILTSGQPDLLHLAAQLWGGEVHEWQPHNGGPVQWRVITEADTIDAVLPPGDPINQFYELWNRGGAVRRCDGEKESKSGEPCICIAQYGPEWHERKDLALGSTCKIETRLSVFLPLEDFGIWRLDTTSYFAGVELVGTVDMIKGLVRVQTDTDPPIPVRLRIDQRQKISDGKTTPYPVVVVEQRGRTMQMLSGAAPSLKELDAATRPAIEAGPADRQPEASGVLARISTATEQELHIIREELRAAGQPPDPRVRAAWEQRLAAVKASGASGLAATTASAAKSARPSDPGEVEPNADAVWSEILSLAGQRDWNMATVEEKFRATLGRDPSDADGWTMAQFRDAILAGSVT